MKLGFFYLPVADLKEALALYRDTLGWPEAWREGETTASLELPGSEVQLMLDQQDEAGRETYRPGPIFVVDSVAAFHARHGDELRFRFGPTEIPGGFWGAFEDPSGNVAYVLDQSTDEAAG
jgi:catechol 2,3-dioxygenase-like lactoylglutathione lyase family enzyme